MKTPITKERLKTHLTYAWWKYLLAVAGCLFAWNIFFSLTATKAAEDQKVELYVYGTVLDEPLDAILERMRVDSFVHTEGRSEEEQGFRDQATFGCVAITPDNVAGIQAFTVRVSTGDGDLLVIPRETYENFAHAGILADLDTLPGVPEAIEAAGITVAETDRWPDGGGVRRRFGIPASQIAVLNSLLLPDGTDCYLCVHANNGNEDVVNRVLVRILEDWGAGGETYTAAQLMLTGR